MEQKLLGEVGQGRFGAWLLCLCAAAVVTVLERHPECLHGVMRLEFRVACCGVVEGSGEIGCEG
jgi:hypothetical protein